MFNFYRDLLEHQDPLEKLEQGEQWAHQDNKEPQGTSVLRGSKVTVVHAEELEILANKELMV